MALTRSCAYARVTSSAPGTHDLAHHHYSSFDSLLALDSAAMSDFDDSDLTDLEDEESYEPASTQQKKKKAAQSDSYRIQGALKAPRSAAFSTQSLHGESLQDTFLARTWIRHAMVLPQNN